LFISLLFYLFFLILTCSCQYSCNLMLTTTCMPKTVYWKYQVLNIQWCLPHNEKILNPIGNIYNVKLYEHKWTEYLCYKCLTTDMTRLSQSQCSPFPIHDLFTEVCNKNNTTGTSSGARTSLQYHVMSRKFWGYQKGVIRSRKSKKGRPNHGQMKKDKHSATKHYTEN
jgi:hypothetical protein